MATTTVLFHSFDANAHAVTAVFDRRSRGGEAGKLSNRGLTCTSDLREPV